MGAFYGVWQLAAEIMSTLNGKSTRRTSLSISALIILV